MFSLLVTVTAQTVVMAQPIGDKTLVAWVSPANLAQRGGAALSIGGTTNLFDAIVFGEIEPARWMAGSNFFERTQQEQSTWLAEPAAPGTLVQIAIAYEGKRVRIYREGAPYAEYEFPGDPAPLTTDSLVLLGLRHRGAANGYFAGAIADARVYDSALTQRQIAGLKLRREAGPEPLGWWTFENDRLEDRVGHYPPGKLMGGAKVVGGLLVLDGVSGCMVVQRANSEARAREGWPIYHVAALPDEGQAIPYDANGCIYWKGKYHLMYIFQRADGGHCWGHLSSRDLVHWAYHPTALEPMPGDPDKGIFSGNAFVNKDGVPMLCWFGVESGVCVATALDDDLIRWQKHPKNPVIPMPKEGEPGFGVYTVWDPYLWLEGDTYMCLLGGNRLPIDRDTLYLCTSPDLVNWAPRGPFYEGDPAWRRPDEDCSCPDFFRLGDKHVLMCISHSIGARMYIGGFAGEVFRPEQHVRMNWPGGMFFAPESLEDAKGRRIFWAWVTDPRVGPAQQATGSGFQSLPRVLALDADGTPRITPAKELERLRDDHRRRRGIAIGADAEVTLDGIAGLHLELALEIDPGQAAQVGLKVRCSPDGQEQTAVWCDIAKNVVRVDMSRSTLRTDVTYGSPPFTSYGLQKASDNPHAYTEFEAPLALAAGELIRLRAFIDGPMLEVFANDRQCVTQVVFPQRADSLGIRLCATGGAATVSRLDAWEMRPLEFDDGRSVSAED